MKVCVGMLFLVLALAGCGEAPAPQTAQTQPARQEVAAPVTAPKASTPLPWDIAPEFEYAFRSRASEGDVNRLVVAYSDLDVQTVDAKLEAALNAKGFKRYKTITRGAEVVGDYGKPNARVTVTVTPEAGSASRGTVYFKWKQ